MTSFGDWFFMRKGFDSFRLEPDKHRQLVLGQQDRAQRDHILESVEESAYSLEGHKSVVYGDFGRGKTHQSKNIMWEIQRRRLPIHPIYVKCTEYKSKEPFSSFFKELVLSIRTEDIQAMAEEYVRRIRDGARPMRDVIDSEDLGIVFEKGLAAPNLQMVRRCMRWLGGEDKIDISLVSSSGPARLNVSKEFGAVMKGLVHLFREVGLSQARVPVFLIDEAERFGLVTQTDTYWTWIAALRELTEINGVGLIFFVGAKTQDDIPAHLVVDEVRTRIGVINYIEFYNPDRAALRGFMVELLATLIRKGPVPIEHRDALADLGVELGAEAAAPELNEIASQDGVTLETFPFTEDALEEFVRSCAAAELANKPRELLLRTQKAATKAMRRNQRVIDSGIVDEIIRESGV
jgi:hypothetical protein